MDTREEGHPEIIGLTGSFGSGCSYTAEHILARKGYETICLSDILRELYRNETGDERPEIPRHELQAFGDKVREEHGCGYLAQQALQRIEQQQRSGTAERWVVDSIRNPEEVYALRLASRGFYLFGVYANREKRWERVNRKKYDDNRKAFLEDDENDTGRDSEPHGQRVGDCFYEADVVLANDSNIEAPNQQNEKFRKLEGTVDRFVTLVSRPLDRNQQPPPHEALMATAYAVGQQSSCMKRKVGAIIVDSSRTVISSGFNEVPRDETPCRASHTQCYRDHHSDEFFGSLKNDVPAVAGHEDLLRKLFRRRFRILDVCRALHAEESAIIALARNGQAADLGQCTMYTTTYPCRLCANKIAELGIKRVVYLEPYPDDEGRAILHGAHVKDEFFQGVTFRAYFRLYGETR